MVSVSAWLMNRCGGLSPQLTSESNDTIVIPALAAWFSVGHSADGSLPAITIASAWAWIAAWIDGICAAAVSAVPLDTTTLPPSSCERLLAALVGDDLVGVLGVLRDEVHRQALLHLSDAPGARRRSSWPRRTRSPEDAPPSCRSDEASRRRRR